MDQVSKPVLIALAAVLVFAVAHFTILAPKDGSGSSSPAAATAPGQAGLQTAVDKANNAVGTSNAAAKGAEQAAAQASGEAGSTTATPTKSVKPPAAKAAKSAAPLPELAKGDRSGPILRDLAHGKVVVALFFNPRGSDDNAALRAVRSANRHHGRVVLHSIPIDDVGDYDAITTGVQVTQAPTVVVMGPTRKARTIVGYTEVKEVDQMVGDVGGRRFQPRPAKHLTGFMAKANNVCAGDAFNFSASAYPTSASTVPGVMHRISHRFRHSRAEIAKISAKGAKQAAAKKALLAAYGGFANTIDGASARISSGAPVGATIVGMLHAGATIQQHFRPALKAVGDHHCLGA